MRVFNVIKISVGMFTNCDRITRVVSLHIGILTNVLSTAHKVFNNYRQYSAFEKELVINVYHKYNGILFSDWRAFGNVSVVQEIFPKTCRLKYICVCADTSLYGRDTFLQSRPQSEMLYNGTAGLEYMIKDVHRGFPDFCRP